MLFNKRVIYRMGSVTPTYKITKRKDYIEINSADSCAISGDKIKMKKRFTHGNIITAKWFRINPGDVQFNQHNKLWFSERANKKLNEWEMLIAKRYNSSGGNGIYLIQSPDDFHQFITATKIDRNKNEIKNYIFEKYYKYSKEYRIHVTKDGCFLADRKMLLDNAECRWHRHNDNCVWISEENPKFDKPNNWDDIVKSCVDALRSIGLDIAAFDVKVQNNKHEYPKWIILESNSAPGLGENSLNKYREILTKMING